MNSDLNRSSKELEDELELELRRNHVGKTWDKRCKTWVNLGETKKKKKLGGNPGKHESNWSNLAKTRELGKNQQNLWKNQESLEKLETNLGETRKTGTKSEK